MSTAAEKIEVKERPILFSAPMVRAILDGRKMQTRRVLQPQPLDVITKGAGTKSPSPTRKLNGRRSWCAQYTESPITGKMIYCRYGEIGDRLWVREVFLPDPPDDGTWCFTNWNDGHCRNIGAIPSKFQSPNSIIFAEKWTGIDLKWMSPIFMPRWASRINLEITNVRVERLQDISPRDCAAEGMMLRRWIEEDQHGGMPFFDHGIKADGQELLSRFQKGWNDINARRGYSWASNPWVWAITFKKL